MISKIFSFATRLLLAAVLIGNPCHAFAADADKPQYYELRIYTTQSESQQQRVNDYWQNAAVPACNRLGIRPVGVFTELEASATNHIYVLIPCDSLEIFGAMPARLAADAAYQKAAAEFLAASKTNAAYERFESSLLVAFDGMKHLALPPADQRPNVFELRTYLSPGGRQRLEQDQDVRERRNCVDEGGGAGPDFLWPQIGGPAHALPDVPDLR